MPGFLRRILSFIVMLIAVAFFPAEAFAGQTLGDLVTNTVNNSNNLPILISVVAYSFGILLAVIGIFKFKDHVDNPQQVPLSAGFKRFFAGGMLLSLPFMMKALRNSIFGTAPAGTSNVVTPLGLPLGPPNSLDEMIVTVITDIAGPAHLLFGAFVYLAGGIILVMGIMRLTKRMDDGPRGPAGFGTIMCFVVAGALFGFAELIASFITTIFGDSDIMTATNIDGLQLNMDPNDQDRVEQVIQSLMYFIGLVGILAFIRGLLVLRAFADGQQGATLAQGLTFIFGGALAVNLGAVVNAIQTTVGLNAITFG